MYALRSVNDVTEGSTCVLPEKVGKIWGTKATRQPSYRESVCFLRRDLNISNTKRVKYALN